MTICASCGVTFNAKRNDARYCGDRCRQRGHRQMSHGETFKPVTDKSESHADTKPTPEPDCYTYDESAPESFDQLMARLTPGNDSAPRDQS